MLVVNMVWNCSYTLVFVIILVLPCRGITFDRYYRYGEIIDYIDNLATSYPLRVQVKSVGKSFENRDIKTITISNGINLGLGLLPKPEIFVTAGADGSAWLGTSAALYLINQLVENAVTNAGQLLAVNWVILPLVNPDGYEYSHETERLWRKNRSPSSGGCNGTFIEVNFDDHFGGEGSSTDECMNIYRGPSPASELETQAVQNELQSFDGNCKLYLTLGASGELITFPYGWTADSTSNHDDLANLGSDVADAISNAGGRPYTVGPYSTTLFPQAGISIDYATFQDIEMAFNIFLGEVYEYPATQLLEVLSPLWQGVKKFGDYVQLHYGGLL